MVKKLYKHEFLSYARVMSIVYAILLTMAAANRIIQMFENDSVAYTIVSIFSGITYGVSVVAAFGFSFVLGIIRFYKNFFTGEGYLTFTLPVTTRQHISVKVITAVCVNAITLVMILISVCIVSLGEMLVEIWKALVYILEKMYEAVGAHIPFFALELAIILLLATFVSVMLYDACIAIGQTSKKNRILTAVGVYFIYYIATQVIGAVLTVVFTILAERGALDGIGQWILNHPYQAAHIGAWGGILLLCAFATVEYFVIKRIITKKLNLE